MDRAPRVPGLAASYLAQAAQEQVEVVELPRQLQWPRVTIVVPTFDRPQLVLDALGAIGRLEGGAFEVVVVDDGSRSSPAEAILQRGTDLGLAGRVVRLPANRGRSVARNVGVARARADLIAFMDDDCLPAPGWLAEGLKPFARSRVGVVQGRTEPDPHQRQPFFNHFIQIQRFDGTFSTCNVLYRREALEAVGGFDPGVTYWEDLDLGWRVRRAGWEAAFAPQALVYHRVIALSSGEWLRWPLHFADFPAKVSRYPEYRRHLFLGVWVNWFHTLFDLALLSLPLAAGVHRGFLALAAPYVVAFPLRHGLRGRWPPAKAALHLAWDAFSLGVLVASSIRHRALVL